jgi:hypothetical protein
MNARMKRASRLMDLAAKALTSARARVAEAQKMVADAQAEAAGHESAWIAEAATFAKGIASSGELVAQAAHLRTLRLVADQASKRLEKAKSDERASADLLLEAARDCRKLELWRNRLAESEKEQEGRDDRRQTDELATRVTRERS